MCPCSIGLAKRSSFDSMLVWFGLGLFIRGFSSVASRPPHPEAVAGLLRTSSRALVRANHTF